MIKTSENKIWIKNTKNWLFETAPSSFVLYSLLAAYAFFFIILNRWIFTDLGLRSFGTVWQFYVDYRELGFVRRALLGTILSISKLNELIPNEYAFAYLFSGILGLTIVALLYHLMKNADLSRISTFAIGFSPSLLPHFGYSSGSFDLLLFVLLCITILENKNLLLVLFLIAIGILSHELFFFYVPFILAISLSSRNHKPMVRDLGVPACIALFSVLVIFSLRIFSAPIMNELRYESMMAAKMPRAAHQLALWSGHFELYSRVSENMAVGMNSLRLMLTIKSLWALIPAGYAILLLVFCVKNIASNRLFKMVLAFGLLFPFSICLVGTDFVRWYCMSANCGLLTIIIFSKRGDLNVSARMSMALLAFCLFSPFGAAQLDWPFPLHQFILEKLIHLLK